MINLLIFVFIFSSKIIYSRSNNNCTRCESEHYQLHLTWPASFIIDTYAKNIKTEKKSTKRPKTRIISYAMNEELKSILDKNAEILNNRRFSIHNFFKEGDECFHQKKEIFFNSIDQELLDRMNDYWPCLSEDKEKTKTPKKNKKGNRNSGENLGVNEKFWQYEWDKHGFCKGRYKDAADYFHVALLFAEKFDGIFQSIKSIFFYEKLNNQNYHSSYGFRNRVSEKLKYNIKINCINWSKFEDMRYSIYSIVICIKKDYHLGEFVFIDCTKNLINDNCLDENAPYYVLPYFDIGNINYSLNGKSIEIKNIESEQESSQSNLDQQSSQTSLQTKSEE